MRNNKCPFKDVQQIQQRIFNFDLTKIQEIFSDEIASMKTITLDKQTRHPLIG